MFRRQDPYSELYGPLKVMFAEEYIFQAETTTVTSLPKYTIKVAAEIRIKFEHVQQHTCL